MNIEHEKLRLVLVKLALLVEKAQTKQLCNRLVPATVGPNRLNVSKLARLIGAKTLFTLEIFA